LFEDDLGSVSEGSHLPDLVVALVGSTEGNDSDDVLASGEVWHVDGSTVTLCHSWGGAHSVHAGVVHEESVALWGVLVGATWWEESLLPLSAFKDNILSLGVLELEPSGFLLGRSEFRRISFDGVNDPVLSVVSVEGLSVVGSPFAKWYPELTLVGVGKISLSFPLFSPERRVLRPWSGVFGETPWVSHLNELVDAFSVLSKAEALEDTISVTSNEVVMADFASSSHWVPSAGTVGNNAPKFIISHLARLMR